MPVRISVPVHGDTTLKSGLQRHFIQEKVHPKVLIDDVMRTSDPWSVASGQKNDADHRPPDTGRQFNLFADFNGLPSEEAARGYLETTCKNRSKHGIHGHRQTQR